MDKDGLDAAMGSKRIVYALASHAWSSAGSFMEHLFRNAIRDQLLGGCRPEDVPE